MAFSDRYSYSIICFHAIFEYIVNGETVEENVKIRSAYAKNVEKYFNDFPSLQPVTQFDVLFCLYHILSSFEWPV